MSFKTLLITTIIIVFVVIATGCSSVSIPTAPKQDQLVLQVDQSLLQPVDRLITLKQYKESQDASKTTNQQRRTRSNP